jgi:hypothetical protein
LKTSCYLDAVTANSMERLRKGLSIFCINATEMRGPRKCPLICGAIQTLQRCSYSGGHKL